MLCEITKCRLCGNESLTEILNLGVQAITGMFVDPGEQIDQAPLVLVKCYDENSSDVCELVQLKHTYSLKKMYGEHYGYRSSLNGSMVEHLRTLVADVLALESFSLKKDDYIVDIGSNDGTLLNQFPHNFSNLIGIDPTARYFRKSYHNHIHVIEDFFSLQTFSQVFPQQKVKLVTSISMFYDLENPLVFAQEVASILEDDGLWIFEQSYLPLMLKNCSFDTICHEHLEYYAFQQIQWLLQRANLKVLDVQLNEINGGSFRLYVGKKSSKMPTNQSAIKQLESFEHTFNLSNLKTYEDFAKKIESIGSELRELLIRLNQEGKKVYGLGASTKGNVLLQYFNIDSSMIRAIGEVNSDKFGKVTLALRS